MRGSAAERINPEYELMTDIQAFEHDPYGFVMYVYPWGSGELAGHDGPDKWQEDILKAVGQGLLTIDEAIQIAVASGNDIGKSALVAWLIHWALSTKKDTRGIVTANTDTQLRTKTWPEVAKWHRLAINSYWFTCTATSLFSTDKRHEKTWRIDAIPWNEFHPEAFSGLHNEGKRIILVFDEASAIADVIWEYSEPAMLDSDTEKIWIAFGNPTRNTGRFRDCFGKFKHRWIHKQIDSRTSRIADKKLIQQWIDDYGLDSDFVKIHVRGMFPVMSAKQFYSMTDVDKAFGKQLRKEQYSFAPKILTVDPAWEGDDLMEVGLRQGLTFKILRTIPKNDNDIQMANLIAHIEDEEKADAVFIDNGFGTGIISAGRSWGRTWRGVWFNEKSADPGCLNKRAEMATMAKKWLKDGGALPEDKELYEDILCPEIVGRTDGLVQIEDKKMIKKRLGRSPGKFDAWILSFAFPVTARLGGRALRKETGVVSEYNPYEREN